MFFQKIGRGRPIVFLHGWGCDGSIFIPVASLLKDNCSYLVDFVGFGKSENPPANGWDVCQYAFDVATFLQTHNFQKVDIVAHSFGCRVAMVLAATYPQLVGKLLLVAPAGLRTFSLKRWCKVANYKIRKKLSKIGLCQMPYGGSVDYTACSPELKNTFVKVVNQDLSPFAKRVKGPTLIVNGKTDEQTPLKDAKRLSKLIKDSALVEIDGGHFALFENPVAFAQAIKIFLGE